MKDTYAFKQKEAQSWFVNNFNSCSEIMSSLGGAAIGFDNASIIDIQWHPIKSTYNER